MKRGLALPVSGPVPSRKGATWLTPAVDIPARVGFVPAPEQGFSGFSTFDSNSIIWVELVCARKNITLKNKEINRLRYYTKRIYTIRIISLQIYTWRFFTIRIYTLRFTMKLLIEQHILLMVEHILQKEINEWILYLYRFDPSHTLHYI